jgi:hypothetical protein
MCANEGLLPLSYALVYAGSLSSAAVRARQTGKGKCCHHFVLAAGSRVQVAVHYMSTWSFDLFSGHLAAIATTHMAIL